ncbi:MAG TPA: hypothetical protein DEQ32_09425, partial [Gammaproteobacteria bacterium]|nr:hypothetical protein [Gammaproteobacteria bacterium]
LYIRAPHNPIRNTLNRKETIPAAKEVEIWTPHRDNIINIDFQADYGELLSRPLLASLLVRPARGTT